MSRLSIFILLMPFLLSVKSACAEELSFSQIMRTFGVALNPADHLSFKGVTDPKGVTNDELDRAIEGLDRAIAVAERAMPAACGLELMPSKVRSYSATEAKRYIVQYSDYMARFLAELQHYRALFVNQRARSAGKRDFHKIARVHEELQEIARQSHSHL